MDQSQILALWKTHEQKLNQAISITNDTRKDVLKIKSRSILSSMKPVKMFTVFIGCLWVITGSIIVVNLFMHASSVVSPFFLCSAALQLLITAIAIFIYLYQLVLIHSIDISGEVVGTQRKLSGLLSSTIWSARILFLQLPLWTTFYLSSEQIINGNSTYIIIHGVITLIFTYAAIWLFINIRYENKDKRWFRFIFQGQEWNPIIESMQYYREIQAFATEEDKIANAT